MAYTTKESILNAVIVDTTGEGFCVGDRTKLSVQFIASGITSGNGVFTIEVSNDNTNWVAYNRLTDNLTNTNTQGDTRVASCTLNSNSTKIYFIPVDDHFGYIRAKVDRTTDGTYSCVLASVI
jgi:hypothetical protein